MPCSDGGWGEAIRNEERTQKINTLTDMLCRVLTQLERGQPFIVDLDVNNWWIEHKAKDQIRNQRGYTV